MTNDRIPDDYRRVLIVDDNEAIHGDFDKILSQQETPDELSELAELDAELFGTDASQPDMTPVDFALTHAWQGQEGLKKLKVAVAANASFGAAFVDMRMPPGWDGVETIENLWKVDPDLQVVICTAFSDHSWDEISARLGQSDQLLILKKPFDEIEVVQLATSLCEKRRLLELSKQQLSKLTMTVGQQATELEVAHENAEALVQSISSLLICLDKNGTVTRWNQLATESLGVSQEQAIGQPFTDLKIKWADPDLVESLVREDGSAQRDNIEVLLTDENGQAKTLDVRVCSIVSDPTSKSKLIVANDITRQKMLQSQLDQAQRLEAVGQLAAGVAHEINTPMQYIGDNVRFVAKTMDRMNHLLDLLPAFVDEKITDEQFAEMRRALDNPIKARKVSAAIEEIPEALKDSIRGVENVAKIVAAMKEFSHPGSDEMGLVKLNHILDSTITVARNEWKFVADMETDFDLSLPQVPAFASELNQAFLNIIVNASHAIGDRIKEGKFKKGKISIATRVDGEYALVRIADTGGGIPEPVRNRIFEPFFTTKDVGKGTGQGLAIAHAVIVGKHNGNLTFDVEEGVGTTFNICIPLEASAPKTDDNIEDGSLEELNENLVG